MPKISRDPAEIKAKVAYDLERRASRLARRGDQASIAKAARFLEGARFLNREIADARARPRILWRA